MFLFRFIYLKYTPFLSQSFIIPPKKSNLERKFSQKPRNILIPSPYYSLAILKDPLNLTSDSSPTQSTQFIFSQEINIGRGTSS